jgi:beta-lactam-binding protein with PASTA domain
LVSVLTAAFALALGFQEPARPPVITRQQIVMPTVINRPLSAASSIIGRYRLRIDTLRVGGPASQALIVVRQSPLPGQPITAATIVRLTVSMIVVPDLSGVMARDVGQVLSANRLQLGRATAMQANGQAGAVVRQAPGPRSLVGPDAPVDIYYIGTSDGPPRAVMPSVIDVTLAVATSILGQFRLPIDTLQAAAPPGSAMQIVQQSPAPGTPITRATRARIVVGMIAVPDLTGLNDAQVTALLQRNGLQPGAAATEVTTGDSGTVSRQQPRAGELVTPATAIDVVYVQPEPQPAPVTPQVDNPPPQTTPVDTQPQRTAVPPRTRVDSVIVPSVRGWSLTSARRILEAGGLRLGRTQVAIATDTIPLVLSQSPDSGARVQRGAAIDVTIPTVLTTSRTQPIWPWVAGGLLVLAGVGAALRSRLSKRERDLIERAKSIVTVSAATPLKLNVTNRSAVKDTSIRYVVRSAGTRIEVRAQVPLVIKEERTHV